MKKQQLLEKGMEVVFLMSAFMSVFAIITICIFMFSNGLPFIFKQGLSGFLLGVEWAPSDVPAQYGILPMIVGSLVVTSGAVIIGVPIGVCTALYLTYFCPEAVYKWIKPAVSMMAAIPSIVYGFFGLQVLVPLMRVFGGNGLGALTASILLGVMILPTIITMSESALRTIPHVFYTGSIGLGASHERTVFHVMLPAAKQGILSAVILGIGRAIGETMAVILVAGNQPLFPRGLTEGLRTMTTNIVLEMAYATGEHRQALIATAVILFIFILVINGIFAIVKRSAHK